MAERSVGVDMPELLYSQALEALKLACELMEQADDTLIVAEIALPIAMIEDRLGDVPRPPGAMRAQPVVN